MTKFVVKCFYDECVGPHTTFEFNSLEEALECEVQEWKSSNNWDNVTVEEDDSED